MFPGSKFGGPAFINFGKNNENAVDSFIYAVSADQWDNGSELRLGRVPMKDIMNASSWEWVSQLHSEKEPYWTHELNNSVPVLSNDGRISMPEMIYLAPIKKFLLLTWSLNQDFSPRDGSTLYIYESSNPWGPFTLFHKEDPWENEQVTPYCPRLPLKWLSHSDGKITGWLQFSGGWYPGSEYYRSNIRPFELTFR